MKKILILIPVLLLTGIIFYACQDANVVETLNDTNRLYSTTVNTVNPWTSGDATFECSQGTVCGDYAYKWNSDPDGGGPLAPPLGFPKEGAPNGQITYEGNLIEITNSNGISFNWTSEYPVCKIIVKGGPAANVYTYNPPVYSGTGLTAPINPSNGKNYGLSHITFCFSEPAGDCWKDETAFGGSSTGPGGNPWWFYYNNTGGHGGVQTIWAGQHYNAGTVEYTGGNIVITLNSNFRLKSVAESVKILGTNTLPGGRPDGNDYPLKGTSLTVSIGVFDYYVIHLDVERKIPCPPAP